MQRGIFHNNKISNLALQQLFESFNDIQYSKI